MNLLVRAISMKNHVSPRARMHKSVVFDAPVRIYGNAVLKRNVGVGCFSFINGGTTVFSNTRIGNFCSIGKNCEIGAVDHPIDWLSTSPFQYNMRLHFPDVIDKYDDFHQIKVQRPLNTAIGHDVWVGSLVIIKKEIHIGTGAIVAGGAVVVKDVPPYSIVGGVPAKILKYRFSEVIIERLLKSKWWHRNISELNGLDYNNIEQVLQKLEGMPPLK